MSSGLVRLASSIGAIAVLLAPILVSPQAAPSAPFDGIPAFGHVFLVIGENTELRQLDPTNAPYLIGTLRPQAAWLTNYYAVGHHSLANYVGMTSGQFTGCDRVDAAPSDCHTGVDNLFDQLDGAGISWQEWLESMPEACSLTTASDLYPIDHNPAVYYDGIEGANRVWSATSRSPECLANVRPTGPSSSDLSAFDAALLNGSVGRFNLIVPDECDAGEKACPPTSDRIRQFDRFLATQVPRILSSPAFGADGVLIVTYDEGTSGHFNFHDRFGRGGRVAFAILGPLIRPGMYSMYRDHFGLLRTLADGFRLPVYLGKAAAAQPLDSVWSG